MRATLQHQPGLTQGPIDHPHGRELQEISAILDGLPELVELVAADLVAGGVDQLNGRMGMSADQVLRAMIIKQMNGFSYAELAFHLADSISYRSFCRIGFAQKTPSRSALQANIKRLKPRTLERCNRELLARAAEERIERGRKVRVDATVMDSNIHAPNDSSLLWDSVRVIARLMTRAREFVRVQFIDHRRRAKRRDLAIQHAKNAPARRKFYRDLLKVSEATVSYGVQTATALEEARPPDPVAFEKAQALAAELRHYIKLAYKVIDQTKKRVIEGQQVPAREKIVSIFEPHTDIIVKDRRQTLFGHKVTVAVGTSGLVLDCVVEEGNPADSTLAARMAERQIALYGRPPRQMAYDGGFASKENLRLIKSLGVDGVAFNKKRGLTVPEMVRSAWVYRRLSRFRAGIEGWISFLKRVFGMGRCGWRSLSSFKAYAWASILSANLLILARVHLR